MSYTESLPGRQKHQSHVAAVMSELDHVLDGGADRAVHVVAVDALAQRDGPRRPQEQLGAIGKAEVLRVDHEEAQHPATVVVAHQISTGVIVLDCGVYILGYPADIRGLPDYGLQPTFQEGPRHVELAGRHRLASELIHLVPSPPLPLPAPLPRLRAARARPLFHPATHGAGGGPAPCRDTNRLACLCRTGSANLMH